MIYVFFLQRVSGVYIVTTTLVLNLKFTQFISQFTAYGTRCVSNIVLCELTDPGVWACPRKSNGPFGLLISSTVGNIITEFVIKRQRVWNVRVCFNNGELRTLHSISLILLRNRRYSQYRVYWNSRKSFKGRCGLIKCLARLIRGDILLSSPTTAVQCSRFIYNRRRGISTRKDFFYLFRNWTGSAFKCRSYENGTHTCEKRVPSDVDQKTKNKKNKNAITPRQRRANIAKNRIIF